MMPFLLDLLVSVFSQYIYGCLPFDCGLPLGFTGLNTLHASCLSKPAIAVQVMLWPKLGLNSDLLF